MTDKEINEAIAEVTEWKGHPFCTDMMGNPFPGWDEPPNYCNDLNSIYEVEQWMKVNRKLLDFFTYAAILKSLSDKKLGDDSYIHTSARQRAEAFLKTFRKWRD